MNDDAEPLAPAFYGMPAHPARRIWADWWILLHPPYTLWHLSYVAIGATVAPDFDAGRLVATLLAFFLAVGVGAHALDELKGRPLRTAITGWALVVAAISGIAGAVIIGLIGVTRVGAGLAVFIVIGVALNCGYNLELFGGRLHTDAVFALAWGAFPVLTTYYAQAETLRPPAIAAAVAAYALSAAQRCLSTPARMLRRQVASVDGTITFADGDSSPISRLMLLAPLEAALKATTWAVVSLAVTLVLYRTTSG